MLNRYFIESWSPGGVEKDRRRSAILFGPSGTAKTSFVKAIAEALGRPLITINMGHFLAQCVPYSSAQAEKIFRSLVEAEEVVILFDEIEEFVRDREKIDHRETRMMVSNMLTLLENLYQEGRGLFFLGTNHSDEFDRAVAKPGSRFDLILKVLPPSKTDKQAHLLKKLKGVKHDVGDVEDFMDTMYDRDLQQLSFKDWDSFADDAANELGKFPANTRDVLREVLNRFDQRTAAAADIAKYTEPSRIR